MNCGLRKKIAIGIIVAVGLTACDTINLVAGPDKSSNKTSSGASNTSAISKATSRGKSTSGINRGSHSNTIYSKLTNENNIWHRVRNDFQMQPTIALNPKIKSQIDWYKQHQDYLYRITSRASPYMYYIYQEIQKRNMPTELILLPIIESDYKPFAHSGPGAAGIWQLMPGTARYLGLKRTSWYDGRRDVLESTKAALDYLSYLQKYFNGDWLLAIAAYDAGPGAVQKAIRHNARLGRNTDFWSLPLSRETHTYVPRLFALADIIKNHERYEIDLPTVQNEPYLGEVKTKSHIKLSDAAKLAGISLDDFRRYNAGYTRTTTPPKTPAKLILPLDKIDDFKEKLAKHPQSIRTASLSTHTVVHTVKEKSHVHLKKKQTPAQTNIAYYRVRRGDSLSTIAKHMGVTTSKLQRWNGSKSTHILKPGQKLLVYT